MVRSAHVQQSSQRGRRGRQVGYGSGFISLLVARRVARGAVFRCTLGPYPISSVGMGGWGWEYSDTSRWRRCAVVHRISARVDLHRNQHRKERSGVCVAHDGVARRSRPPTEKCLDAIGLRLGLGLLSAEDVLWSKEGLEASSS